MKHLKYDFDFAKEYLTANWRLAKVFDKDPKYKHMKPEYNKFIVSDETVNFITSTYFDLIRLGWKPDV